MSDNFFSSDFKLFSKNWKTNVQFLEIDFFSRSTWSLSLSILPQSFISVFFLSFALFLLLRCFQLTFYGRIWTAKSGVPSDLLTRNRARRSEKMLSILKVTSSANGTAWFVFSVKNQNETLSVNKVKSNHDIAPSITFGWVELRCKDNWTNSCQTNKIEILQQSK